MLSLEKILEDGLAKKPYVKVMILFCKGRKKSEVYRVTRRSSTSATCGYADKPVEDSQIVTDEITEFS